MTALVTGNTPLDPYLSRIPASPWRYLHHLNPLAKLAAPVLPILAMLFVHNLITPLALLVFAILVLLTGERMTRILAGTIFVGIPVAIALVAVGFSLWTDPSTLADPGTPVVRLGDWTLVSGALFAGLTSSVRLTSMITLAFISGAATAGPDLVRAAVQHLHVPYRIGYTALAAYRFVPRFRHELGIIRAAHRVRGHHAGRGPIAAVARWWGYILPLMAGAIRHAERVALAMDSRAFGAHDTRTERHLVPWRTRDWVFLATFTAACVLIFAVTLPLGG